MSDDIEDGRCPSGRSAGASPPSPSVSALCAAAANAPTRLYSGVIVVEVRTPGNIHHHNEHFVGTAESRASALGQWIAAARAKHPQGAIVWESAYDISGNAAAFVASLAQSIEAETP